MTDSAENVVYEVANAENRTAIQVGSSGYVNFTITNRSDRRIRTGVKVRVEGDAQETWCKLQGESERDLAPKDAAHYTLQLTIPAGTPSGSSKVTLTAYAVDDPANVFTRGNWVQVDHAEPKPKWIFPALAAAGVVIVGLVTWLVLRNPELPKVTITADALKGLAPLTVHFQASATPDSPEKWEWTFGDAGAAAVGAEVSFEFADPGVHRVQVIGRFGDEEVGALEVVEVGPRVEAQMTVLNERGSSPLAVRFKDESSGVQSRAWDFGDGSPASSEEDTTHTYTNDTPEAKSFVAKLTVTGLGEGNVSEVTQAITVEPKGMAAFTVAPEIGYAPLRIQCTDSSTGEGTRSWDFGGQGNSTEGNPAFTFAAAGQYDVALTLANGEQAVRRVLVYTEPKIVSFVATPAHIARQSEVTFTWKVTGDVASATATAGDGGTLSLLGPAVGPAVGRADAVRGAARIADAVRDGGARVVDLEDRVVLARTRLFAFQPEGSTTYQYQGAGTFEANLVVEGRAGKTFSSTQRIVVDPLPGDRTLHIDPSLVRRMTDLSRFRDGGGQPE